MNTVASPPRQTLPPGTCHFPAGPSFSDPVGTRTAGTLAEVRPALEWARAEVRAGRWVAGYIAYEAAPAFEPAFAAHSPGELPLLWLASYAGVSEAPPATTETAPALPWRALISEQEYGTAFATIREHIGAGDTYQVNYTFPLEAAWPGGDWPLFCALTRAQAVPHACYLNTGRLQVLSLSPELFFSLRGGVLRARPMKGTRPRGRWAEADAALAEALAASAKDRAENVMITDMLRNDMGRICRAGSMAVERLFEVERYATVWQMTSTIRGETEAEVPEILAALFPSASVTGAPKIQTSRIIHALEPEPRGVYCGALGWWAPDGSAEFSVGIRTLVADSARGVARYHVGSGITWDATPGAEYQECLDKAALLLAPRSEDFELLESIRWEAGAYWLLEEHWARLRESAAYFGIALDEAAVAAALTRAGSQAPDPARVRLLVARDGAVRTEVYPLEVPNRPWRVALAATPISRGELFLYHKTTRREVYAAARAARPDVDDVLLWNEAGELTESTVANVALELDGEWLTPARGSGLLAGTMRARWLAEGKAREAVLRREDLARAARVVLLNSVRGEISVEIVK